MPSINTDQQHSQAHQAASFVKLDASDIPELAGYPQGVYAQITVPVSDLSTSPSLSGESVIENTAYQDTPFNGQVAVTTNAAQITANANKGWITLTIDPDTTDEVYIGAAGVTTGTGSILKASNPSLTMSSDDLSEWFVIGAAGGEKLYVIGAYIS
tara:strand:+ start:105352 stop:105819 length:468 start_codon:yes stop_codon:yes gene_type:complete